MHPIRPATPAFRIVERRRHGPPSGMRASAVASQDHQRSLIRRRRNETRTLRLRSSRTGLGLTHALCLNIAILESCCQSSTSCPSTNCLAYSIAVPSSGHTSPIARLIKAVFVHDLSSILGHIGVTPKSLRTTSIPSRLSGSGF